MPHCEFQLYKNLIQGMKNVELCVIGNSFSMYNLMGKDVYDDDKIVKEVPVENWDGDSVVFSNTSIHYITKM